MKVLYLKLTLYASALGLCIFSYKAIKVAHRYAVQESDTTMMAIAF